MIISKVFLIYYGYANGDINMITSGLNGASNNCGVGMYNDYPLVYFSNYTTNLSDSHEKREDFIFNSAICVSECPNGGNVTCMPDSNFVNTTNPNRTLW
jgi:hypothetical protein